MDVPLSTPPEAAASRLQAKLEAAMILRGVVRIVLDDGLHEVQPRTMYRERGTGYLEAKRRDSGERMRVRLDQIRDVLAY